MAAGSFGASALQRLQIRLSEMYADPNTSMTEHNNSVNAAQAILTQQTARIDDRLLGNKCVGVKAWFPRYASDTDSEVDVPTDCTIPSGVEAETVSRDFDSAVLVHNSMKAKDNRCDNEFSFIEESAGAVNHIMHLNRLRLCELMVNRLAARAQVNLDGDIPSTWDDTDESPVVLIPKAEMVWDSLGSIQAMTSLNNFGSFYMLSGRNFWVDKWASDLLINNGDCCKPSVAAYGQLNIFYDLRNIDPTLGYPSTFIIDRNSHAFWNTAFSSAMPVETQDNVFTWFIPDPILQWSNNGVLSPVLHEFEMKKTCVGRTTLSQRQHSYEYWGRIIGGFESVPTGINGEKGVLLLRGV